MTFLFVACVSNPHGGFISTQHYITALWMKGAGRGSEHLVAWGGVISDGLMPGNWQVGQQLQARKDRDRREPSLQSQWWLLACEGVWSGLAVLVRNMSRWFTNLLGTFCMLGTLWIDKNAKSKDIVCWMTQVFKIIFSVFLRSNEIFREMSSHV